MPEQVGPPNPFPPADVIPVRRVGRWLRYAAVGWAAGAGACALLLVTTVVTLVHRAQAQDLERDGVEVVAEITEAESGTYSLGVVYSLPGEHEVREGRAAVDFPEDWDVGGRYPAVVDPDAPRRLRLLTEPYDAVAPIVWAAIPAAVVSPWLVWSGRRWRRQQRAGGGRWITADSWVLGYRTSPTYGRVVELAIARPGAMAPSCLIRVPPDPWLDGPRWVRRRLDITEVTAVGDPLAVRIGDRLLFPVRAARTPRRT